MEKYPPISPGTRVRTTKENKELAYQWTSEGKARKQWGREGTVITHHDSHGLCYDVLHDDGSHGSYDPSELKVIT